MSIYDSNTESIEIPGNSVISSINSNCGRITVGPNCKISECKDNCGRIQFEHGSYIGNINNNCGRISVANGSKVDSITYNCGRIRLAPNCVSMNTVDNVGSIVGGRHNIYSGAHSLRVHNNHYDYGNILYSGERTNSIRETWSLILGSFADGLLNLFNFIKHSNGKKDAQIAPVPSFSDSLSNDADKTLCIICMERPKKVAFQCGHLCCTKCSKRLQTCHMCRVEINQKIDLFL